MRSSRQPSAVCTGSVAQRILCALARAQGFLLAEDPAAMDERRRHRVYAAGIGARESNHRGCPSDNRRPRMVSSKTCMGLKIDVFNHILPRPFFDRLQQSRLTRGRSNDGSTSHVFMISRCGCEFSMSSGPATVKCCRCRLRRSRRSTPIDRSRQIWRSSQTIPWRRSKRASRSLPRVRRLPRAERPDESVRRARARRLRSRRTRECRCSRT